MIAIKNSRGIHQHDGPHLKCLYRQFTRRLISALVLCTFVIFSLISARATAAPTVTGFWPSTGNANSFIFVFGSHFGTTSGTTQIQVNGISSSVIQPFTSDLLFFMVPPGNTNGPVCITTSQGSACSAASFGTLLPGVAITSIWPGQGRTGSFVFIFGAGFDPAPGRTQVSLGGTPMTRVQVVDASLIVFIVPPGATSGTVRVTTPLGTATSPVSFTVAPTPTISLSANPTSITSGGLSTLTWSSINATACVASGGWTGTLTTSGIASTGALNTSSTFTLTCTGSGGSASQSVTVSVAPPPSTDLIFFDNFEYDVGRDALDAADRFRQLGHWDWVKTEQSNEPGANGNLYTVSSIPGYTGVFPGNGSQRVLAMEARPDLGDGQTDFYLQHGSGERPIGHIPPNHWFQFWAYSPDVEGQRSRYTNAKFIYPNRATYYPATLSNGGFIYIMGLNKRSKTPRNIAPCGYDRDVGCPSAFLNTGWNRSQGLTNRILYEEEDFGANLADDTHLPPNQWTLVKIHIDISGTDPRATPGQAVFEMWIRRYGSPTWVKTTEYIGGVTNIGGGAIDFTPAFTDGFRMLRIPTTFGSASPSPMNWLASWTYIDDFAIARSESALPQY